MSNYISISDVDNWADGMSDDDKQEVIDGVEQTVERITKDYFYAKSFDMKFNGNDRNRLYLPIKQKILSVTAVYIDEIELQSTEWDYDENSIFASISSIEIDPIELAENEKLFPRGHNNINIVGTLGWSACPFHIKKACIMLVKFDNDDTLYEAYRFQSERLGEYSYTRNGKSYTGMAEVDEYLNRFINRRPILTTY
jgi:hypothetical protein